MRVWSVHHHRQCAWRQRLKHRDGKPHGWLSLRWQDDDPYKPSPELHESERQEQS